MPARHAFVLLVSAAWTVLVWAVFIRNIVGDDTHSTGFKVVHVVLAVVSLAFAVATVAIVLKNRRQA